MNHKFFGVRLLLGLKLRQQLADDFETFPVALDIICIYLISFTVEKKFPFAKR
jgi:hypothetical protein